MDIEKFQAALEAIVIVDDLGNWDPLKKTYTPCERSPHIFTWGFEQVLRLSAEDGGYFADYYGEYRGGYPWIHEEVLKVAEAHGMFAEWCDPSHIAFYPA